MYFHGTLLQRVVVWYSRRAFLAVRKIAKEGPIMFDVLRCSGPVADRQDASHPHSAVPSPVKQSLFYVADLGTDEIYAYEVVEAKDKVLKHHAR